MIVMIVIDRSYGKAGLASKTGSGASSSQWGLRFPRVDDSFTFLEDARADDQRRLCPGTDREGFHTLVLLVLALAYERGN